MPARQNDMDQSPNAEVHRVNPMNLNSPLHESFKLEHKTGRYA